MSGARASDVAIALSPAAADHLRATARGNCWVRAIEGSAAELAQLQLVACEQHRDGIGFDVVATDLGRDVRAILQAEVDAIETALARRPKSHEAFVP